MGEEHSFSAEAIVDSGAESTLVASATAARAALRPLDRSLTVHGAAGCATRLTPVAIARWSAGPVSLPPTTALSSGSPVVSSFGGTRIKGVIGADILASFGRVTLDFTAGRLVFGPR